MRRQSVNLGISGVLVLVMVACGTAPGEPDPGAAGASLALAPPPVYAPPPVCATPPGSLPYQASTPRTCLVDSFAVTGWRSFNGTPFEQALVKLGCAYGLVNGTRSQVHAFAIDNYSMTACPDSCELGNLLAANVSTLTWTGGWIGAKNPDGTPIDAHRSVTSPWSCSPQPPAGIVYVEWDPRCPGGCPTYGF